MNVPAYQLMWKPIIAHTAMYHMPFAILAYFLQPLKNVADLCSYQLATMHVQMHVDTGV